MRTRLSGALRGSNGCPVRPPGRRTSVQILLDALVDDDGRPAGRQAVEPLDIAVLQAHAAVRRTAGDELRLVRAVEADDAAAGPVRQARRIRARADRVRAVQRHAVDPELLADVEVA